MTPRAVLIGPPAAGKTRLGKRVAKNLGLSFVDTDSLVAQSHGSISQIFAEHGEPTFRAWEREAVQSALRTDGIVSLGGGAILAADTQSDLYSLFVVLVTASSDAIESRLESGNRPLLTGGIESWKSLVESRQPIYSRLANITLDTSHGTMDNLADELTRRIEDLT